MAGRPKAKVYAKMVETLAGIGCTVSEIAAVCEVNKRTIERNFVAALEKGRECGKMSLRRMQWKSAKAGSVTMQIWLGRQLLGQKDNPDVHVGSIEFGLGELPTEVIKLHGGSSKVN